MIRKYYTISHYDTKTPPKTVLSPFAKGGKFGVGLATPPRKKYPATETEATVNINQRSIQKDASAQRPMTQAGESLMEASLPTHLLSMKAKTKVGTWNVRTMY
ncbi:hypothetical protein DPMN_014766 [Dreissena polymorpha]|uniref:Uncharacterized protein n=1 Tax=Dreissena polymorpha TaxID=45954 RepID=A0A9D4NAB0_DREPO|nr:hypothetical protein DPMN_014766 [Dreissena polymorpha]